MSPFSISIIEHHCQKALVNIYLLELSESPSLSIPGGKIVSSLLAPFFSVVVSNGLRAARFIRRATSIVGCGSHVLDHVNCGLVRRVVSIPHGAWAGPGRECGIQAMRPRSAGCTRSSLRPTLYGRAKDLHLRSAPIAVSWGPAASRTASGVSSQSWQTS